ncbi:hypothetical protein ACIBKY_33270 [Nonomuraea sp. NPDC050394]|uniref:hypothetical protein n=1 Tax=Nonomuraea sp. NPDC050394 TaxID=3364363 RepID=UPI0037A59C63
MHDDEILARNETVLESFEACEITLTLPDHGTLTAAEAIQRLGYDPALATPGQPEQLYDLGDLAFYQAGNGVITVDLHDANAMTRSVISPLGGPGFRHWYVGTSLSGPATFYWRYDETEGHLEGPEAEEEWTIDLGPMATHSDLITTTLGEDAEFTLAAAYLSIIERDSGLRFTDTLHGTPDLVLPEAAINWPGA